MSKAVQKGYNQWAGSYDSVENKTRDLDKLATQTVLRQFTLGQLLELGCGTGKNTEWLSQHAARVTAVDFSDAMMQQAKEKIKASNVSFVQADIKNKWLFKDNTFDMITCNLILEHIQDLKFVFAEAARVLKDGGRFFISELHPFKQYTGSKARFENEGETIFLECYVHHISDFFDAAIQNGFNCLQLKEWFDDEEKKDLPRLVSFVFEKKM